MEKVTKFSKLLLIWWSLVSAQDEIREPPRITIPAGPEERFLANGSNVTLLCSASGTPNPMYEWYFNGAPLLPNNNVSFDRTTGTLYIKSMSIAQEGFYSCWAKNTFTNGLSAVAISHKIEVQVARIGDWLKLQDREIQAREGGYGKIECDDNKPSPYGPTSYKWYLTIRDEQGKETLQELVVTNNERLFIDSTGTLHFSHVEQADEGVGRFYSCALSSAATREIKLGRKNRLTVTAGAISETGPALQFSTKSAGPNALTFKRTQQARLECFFSGYVSGQSVPTIQWYDSAGTEIFNGDKYLIQERGRVLIVRSLQEEDEKPYTCRGSNRLGNTEGNMLLDVTSAPIWMKSLQHTTVPQGQNAIFNCDTRSASMEPPPNEPKWRRNGIVLDDPYDPNKYEFLNQKRTLVVKSVQKSTDIACFQCFVSNHVGEVFSDGCLNVILPIQFIVQPQPEQIVEKGDLINLTVVATSDLLYPVSYLWIFNNETYEGSQAPPHVSYDSNTKLAFINTSLLTNEELQSVKGVYHREVFHLYQKMYVTTEVKLKDDPAVVPVVEAGFDYWIIGLIIGILLILIILLIICCVICRRKMLEGEYPVDKKETAAGLDPEKELKDSGFHDLSRADYDDYPEKKSPALDFDDIPIGEGDDESFGSNEYGEEATAFNEDGSFIGVYSRNKNPSGPPPYQPATESNV